MVKKYLSVIVSDMRGLFEETSQEALTGVRLQEAPVCSPRFRPYFYQSPASNRFKPTRCGRPIVTVSPGSRSLVQPFRRKR